MRRVRVVFVSIIGDLLSTLDAVPDASAQIHRSSRGWINLRRVAMDAIG
jgi:hypothetical protein